MTLAVDDLDRTLAFDRDGLGLRTPGVAGTDFAGENTNGAAAVVMFELKGSSILALYPRTELATSGGGLAGGLLAAITGVEGGSRR